MKSVLFFGDSNTWAYAPNTGERYPYEQRWTTVAARLLGEGYACIPAGLNGRTTVYDDPYKGCRNGAAALDFELQQHKPLDLVVIMLGTNDLKFGSASMACRGMERLASMVMNANARFATSSPVFPGKPELLIVSPILVHENIRFADEADLMPDGAEESKKFAPLYRALAERIGAHFLDAALYASPEPADCEHMTREGHAALGRAMAEKIREILG